ncbi:MAG: extracellular solute-binding protein [Spirochaetales bacterium]|nr:extracellular solute-binding protein [Spirochaetales bacterium]
MKYPYLPVILLIILLFSSCGGSVKEDSLHLSAPGVLPIVDKPLAMTIMLSNVTQLDKDWQNNDASAFMEEVTGIQMTYNVVPNLDQARKLAITSDTMPDIFMGETKSSDIMQNGPEGYYLPLNKLIEDHAPAIKKNFEEYPLLKKVITTPDGTIYGLPSVNDDFHGAFGQKMWINRTWLENLKLEMPQTTEEFYKVLIAFRDQDPNGNGIQDEIPWTGSKTGWFTKIPGALLNSFLYVNEINGGLYLQNGRIHQAYTDSRYRDALALTARFYAEDLLDPMALTQSQKNLMDTAEKKGDNILGVVNSGYWGIFTKNGGESGRYKEYDLVPPLIGPEGVQTSGYYMKIIKDCFVISSSCKSPEAAIKWADYIATPEGAWNTQFGREGLGWIRPPEGAVGLNGLPALFIRLNPQESGANWGFDPVAPRFQPASQRLGEMKAPPEEYYNPSKVMTRLSAEVLEKYVDHKPDESMIMPPVYLTAEETTLVNENIDRINDYIDKSTVAFITGSMDIETEWDMYLEELENRGLARILELYQKAYNRQFGN